MQPTHDYLNITARNFLVNGERVYFSTNIYKFSDTGFRYETVLVLTDQAIYNLYQNAVKRRTSLSLVDAVTISTKGSEFVIHIDRENDYRFFIQDKRNDVVEALLHLICEVRKQAPQLKVYEVDLLNLNGITTDKARAARNIKVRPKEEFAKFLNLATWTQHQRQSLDKRLARRRNTQTLYINPKMLMKEEICLDDFEILKVLGKGAFGKVVLAQKKDNHKYYAIKMLKKAQIISTNMFQKTLAEKTILQEMNSPFLVGLEYAFQTETKLYFVLEFMVGGELFNHIRREGRFTEQRAKFYAICIIFGIGFLHDHNYIYRDLKLENVLLDDKGYAVLTDFGFAKFLAHNEKTRTFCGTPDYVAPEILSEQGHDRMVDWWSLGVLIYEMIHGQTPFFSPNRDMMYQNIKLRQIQFPSSIQTTDACKDVIIKLLNKNPSMRLGQLGDSREILAHPWFADTNIQAIYDKQLPPPFKPNTQSLENNFEQEFLNEDVRESVDQGPSHIDRSRIQSYEKDFEQMNFNKDSVNKRH